MRFTDRGRPAEEDDDGEGGREGGREGEGVREGVDKVVRKGEGKGKEWTMNNVLHVCIY